MVYTLTSPPAHPKPVPAKELIAKTITYSDRKVYVTVPFPDTLELVLDVLDEHMMTPDVSGKPAKAIYEELDENIRNHLLEISKFKGADFSVDSFNPTHSKAVISIRYDPIQPLNRATITLTRKMRTDYPAWRLKLEFSAGKAGKKGILKLIATLQETVLGFLNWEVAMKWIRVSRIDAAVDCIGVFPIDLIAHIPKPGKRMVFVGENGRPESIYYYQKRKPLSAPPKKLSVKTRGPHRLTLYERRDYCRQLLLDPPYGDAPVTRAEVSTRWTTNRPLLCEILKIKNPFKGRRVAYAAAVPPISSKEWRRFCAAVLGGGIEPALYQWLPGPGAAFAKSYDGCIGDLIDETCWIGWPQGIACTGLNEMVEFE